MIRAIALALTSLISVSALASGEHVPQDHKRPLGPSSRYSGGTPIDLSNGLTGSNGTYGLPNKEYEEWATAPLDFPGLSQKDYPYNNKKEFIQSIDEQIMWGTHAIANYKQTSAETKPEAVEYSKQAIEALTPALERLKEARSKVKGAGESEWQSAQSNAKKAVLDLRGAYTQMHKNVRM